MKNFLFLAISVLVIAALAWAWRSETRRAPADVLREPPRLGADETPKELRGSSPAVPATPASALGFPLDRAHERVTKKPFGFLVTPDRSPVSPERFSGYHAGVDFEIFADEEDADVIVLAVCDGPLVFKKTASGYGGVAVQRCVLDGADVTIVYGHLKLSSVAADVGEALSRGGRLGVLGKGFSAETDGERKHLHLGVHKGASVSILGYVPRASGLDDWLDARAYFPL